MMISPLGGFNKVIDITCEYLNFITSSEEFIYFGLFNNF